MQRFFLLAPCLALLPLAPALATDVETPKTIAVDPARRAAAEAFARSIELRKQLTAANEIAAGQIESSVLRQIIESNPKSKEARNKNPERFDQIIDHIQSFIGAEIRKINSELEPTVYSETIEIYARTFTESELHEIQGFYASPLGQKLLDKQPELMKECIAMSQRLMVQKMPALFDRLKKVIETEGFTLSDAKAD